MAEKRLFIWCSYEDFVKRQRLLGIPAKVELLELLWVREILPRMKSARNVLGLASTCRFFRDLYAQQPSRFWHEQCVRFNWNQLVYSPNINYKAIFISATLIRCIDCHKLANDNQEETTWTAYLHEYCKNPNPIISASKAAKDFHISPTLVKTLPNVRPDANPRYFIADVQAAAYEHCGSKEQWEQKHAKSLKRQKATEEKKKIVRLREIKELVDPVVALLGKDFEFGEWQTSDVREYILSGKTRWSRESKYVQLQRLSWIEIKRRLENVIAKQMKTKRVHINRYDIDTWFRAYPEKLKIFKAFHIQL